MTDWERIHRINEARVAQPPDPSNHVVVCRGEPLCDGTDMPCAWCTKIHSTDVRPTRLILEEMERVH